MTEAPRLHPLVALAAFTGAALIVLAQPLLDGVWHNSHEGIRYLALADLMHQAILEGELYPRWLLPLYGGYGYPTFVFYQPALFFAALPASLLLGPQLGMYATLAALLAAGGCAVFALLRHDTDDLTALFGGLLFLLTPYIAINLYIRGDLSELMAMLVFPAVLLGLRILRARLEAARPATGPVLFTAAMTALLITAHPIIAFFGLPLAALYGLHHLSLTAPALRRAYLTRALVAGLAGVAIATPYWHATLSMRPHVQIDRAFVYPFLAELHTVELHQLVTGEWAGGASSPGDADDTMPFHLGLAHALLAAIGLALGWRRPLIRRAALVYALLIVAMTPLAAPLWERSPLSYAQFPWRLLAVIATVQVLVFSGAAEGLSRLSTRWRASLLAATLLVLALTHRHQYEPLDTSEKLALLDDLDAHLRRHWEPFASANEFLPKTARRQPERPLMDRPRVDVIAGEAEIAITHAGPDARIEARVEVTGDAGARVLLRQLYFPGWRVEVDGEPLPDLDQDLTETGLMTLELGRGAHTLRALYEGPPGWPRRALIAAAALVALGGFAARERRTG